MLVGGGSGGAVYVRADVIYCLNCSKSSVLATGGMCSSGGGSGGGGRIHLDCISFIYLLSLMIVFYSRDTYSLSQAINGRVDPGGYVIDNFVRCGEAYGGTLEKTCQAGKIPILTDNIFYCVSCQEGFYSRFGESTCTPCPKGSFSNVTGSPQCTLCNPGTFSSELNSTSCNVCPYSTNHFFFYNIFIVLTLYFRNIPEQCWSTGVSILCCR